MPDLVLDVGQSSSRARLLQDGMVIAEFDRLPGFVSGASLTASLLDRIERASDAFRVDRLDRIAIGSTGLFGAAPPADDLGRQLHGRFGAGLLRLADDGVTAFLGALNGQQGALVAAGTGVVAFAWGPRGTARADGVGAMLGDDGSGWWIGRAGLIAAVSAADGREPASAALLHAATARYGPLAQLPQQIAASPSPIGAVAAFAKDVADVARAGDEVAAGIWQTAGSHIAESLLAVAARAGLGIDLQWSLLGNVALAIDLLEPTLSARILDRYADARRIRPLTSALDGVARLLDLPDVRQFHPMVSEFCASSASSTSAPVVLGGSRNASEV